MIRKVAKPEKEEKEHRVTFFSKDALRCPVCDESFHREELFLGRVNAGSLTDELHRNYIPTQTYGEVHPLIYDLTVCPSCWFSAFKYEFASIPAKFVGALSERTAFRVEAVQRLFAPLDFSAPRGLMEGAAAYYLAMLSYEVLSKDFSPAIKQGIASIRCAWLCDALAAKKPGEHYEQAAGLFYSKARIMYRLAMELDQSGKERLSQARWLGPDTDKNYGYEGVLYMSAVLELKYGPRDDEARRAKALEFSKRAIAKMFGLGKRSKAKPGPLMDSVRDLYDTLKAELKQDDDEDDD